MRAARIHVRRFGEGTEFYVEKKEKPEAEVSGEPDYAAQHLGSASGFASIAATVILGLAPEEVNRYFENQFAGFFPATTYEASYG